MFLNIAHRSQVVVHRQLAVLDKAERTQEDPEQLELLFQLDHLATHARRNAENLLILAGGQPGRKWRKPVNTIAMPAASAAAITSASRREPPGWIAAVAPARIAASSPSANG